MKTNLKDLADLETSIDAKKVGDMVIDALQASTADIMMAYCVMIKSTLIGMELTEEEKAQAKALFDQMYPQILVDQLIASHHTSSVIH
jgi:hypothetical protein